MLRWFFTATTKCYSTLPYLPRREAGSFFGRFVENLKQEFNKSKQLKENLAKFREEREKLEQSEALREARAKFKKIEAEAASKKTALKKGIEGISKDISESVIGEIGKTAVGSIAKQGEKIGKTQTYKKVSSTAAKICEELDTTGSSGYKPPKKLRKRNETPLDYMSIKPNTTTTAVELHQDSRFAEKWEKFKRNNKLFNTLLGWKDRFESSDSMLTRTSYALRGTLHGFLSTDTSVTLSTICKVEPDFSEEKFLTMCKDDIVPNLLEASIRGNEEILRDWCSPQALHTMTIFQQVKKEGGQFFCEILDLEGFEIISGKVLDEGPVILFRFKSDQKLWVIDKNGKLLMGDKKKVTRVKYMWVLKKNMNEFNPRASWTLLEASWLSCSLVF